MCLHGVPSSCFLYRKVIAELGGRGVRGVTFDLPGLGLADRPEDFDYTWTGLGRFTVAASWSNRCTMAFSTPRAVSCGCTS